jgi:dipeptidyl-peptidase-3
MYSLENALPHVQNPTQTGILGHCIESFKAGNLDAYREAQKLWVKDTSPSVDQILEFVETYRDPHGVRAEWEGVVCIADPDETKKMEAFIKNAAKFATLLPWASAENSGKGPFEKDTLEIPHFAIVHGTY